MLTAYEASMIQSIYDYNRIPLWIFNDAYQLQYCFIYEIQKEVKEKLSMHIRSMILRSAESDFDILYYENELYYMFSFICNSETYYFIGGPILLSGFYHITEKRLLSFASTMNAKELHMLVENLPVASLNSFSSCLRMMMLLLKKTALSPEEIANYKFSDMQSSVQHTLTMDLFENSGEYRLHTPYSQEVALLNCVKEGDLISLESIYRTLPRTKYGNMSNTLNPIRQLFYGSIANTTLITRYAIEGGLEEETAFTLSDTYIKRMENCATLYELNTLNEKMAIDFTKRVAESKALKQPDYSKAIKECMDYICRNVHTKINLAVLAKEINMTPKYISYLFHKETGQTLTAFIEDMKVNKAKNLLVYSQYSCNDISQYLCFNSQSYFISIFKKKVGMTPKKYRDKYSKSHW